MTTRITELEHAVCTIIQIIKQIPELVSTKLAVTDGLALWHYFPDYRSTNGIDLIVELPTCLEWLETRLLVHPNSPFVRREQDLFYHSPTRVEILIKFHLQCPDLCPPVPLPLICELRYGAVPYISIDDLLISKINSSQRPTASLRQKERDADDARALMTWRHSADGHAADPVTGGHMLRRSTTTSTNPKAGLQRPSAKRNTTAPLPLRREDPIERALPNAKHVVRGRSCSDPPIGSKSSEDRHAGNGPTTERNRTALHSTIGSFLRLDQPRPGRAHTWD